MNSKPILLAALAASLLSGAAFAQNSPAAAPAAPPASEPAVPSAPVPAAPGAAAAAPAPVVPQAYPAKVALVAFEQAVYATNEGMRAADDVRKKYQTQKDKIDAEATEIDTLKKQLQAAPATLSDQERATRLKTIDTKDKAYQRDVDDATNAYQADLQEALSKVAQKVSGVMQDYVQKNGYTILLNIGDQQSPVMWWARNPSSDITEAVIEAYNKSSGIAAPPPEAPAAAKPKPAAPATHTAPKPTTPGAPH